MSADPAMPEESGDYLVSLADLMAGLLFVFIITLMVFLMTFQGATTELTNTERLRTGMLQQIAEELSKRGVRVLLVEDNGVLRLTENEILFPSGSAELREEDLPHLAALGEVLEAVLSCYAGRSGDPPSPNCHEDAASGRLEAVFLEGHTDNTPIHGGRFEDNWVLSAQRALYTYRFLLRAHPGLGTLVNHRGQPLFSVSGYGDGRPVVAHATPTPGGPKSSDRSTLCDGSAASGLIGYRATQ
ncbi:Flagellar motor protein [Gammaproteobacteria bacterium]